jgi:hypothetical protein
VFTPNGSNTSGTFSWTPTVSDNGVYVVNFRAANALVDLATTAINVGNKLRGYWTLDGSGTDGATGHMLVASGGVTYAAGHLGPAADVSGAAAGRLSVSAPGSDYDLTSGGFTFECWLNSRSLAFGIDPRIAFAGTEGGTPAYWEIHVCDEGCTTGRARVRVVAGVSVVELQSNATIADGTWHHVATTYDGTKLRLYVDGVADDSLSQSGLTIATSGGSFSIGARPSGANQFDGLLDDVRLWGRARTQSEIQTYMNRELGFPAGVDGNAPRFSNHLGQNRPNPFNPDTRIDFELEHSSHVRVVVFDVSGRRVATLLDREMSLGPHQVTWEGRDDGGQAVGSGIYFYRIEALGFHRDRKMVLLK